MIRLLLAILGIGQTANGLLMLALPAHWYVSVPGVALTGPFNPHFARDVGLAFLVSGVGLMLGAGKGRDCGLLAAAGAAWPALHGLFHVWEWIAQGVPSDPKVAMTEAVGVVLAGGLGVVLAGLRLKGERKCSSGTFIAGSVPSSGSSATTRATSTRS